MRMTLTKTNRQAVTIEDLLLHSSRTVMLRSSLLGLRMEELDVIWVPVKC